MPCNSDYMKADQGEINLSVVYGLLDELETGKLPSNFGDGYDKRVYNKTFPKQHIDEKTEELCSKLQNVDVSKFSLEMQMWWRDHQKADKERLEKEIKDKATEQERQKALSKLSAYERKLLNLR
jgi:hypothetical protein